ncbi:hypothetical protein EDC28_103424 [Gallaecimonas pentaromativorans]|uniref:Uncharacterized protein n=1 Tax=Gallaecimonas pentaromativorans TaxID=584787 RepID=A0A3N1PLS3_9GAMM|nr:hypothetical protein EDC28_103424 [Gallaecimonas pentaromativorans]
MTRIKKYLIISAIDWSSIQVELTLPPLSHSSHMLIASLLSLSPALGNLPWRVTQLVHPLYSRSPASKQCFDFEAHPLSHSSHMLIASLLSLSQALENLPWRVLSSQTSCSRSLAKNGSLDRFLNALTPARTSCVTRAILALALRAVVAELRRSNLFQKDLSRKAALKQCFNFELYPWRSSARRQAAQAQWHYSPSNNSNLTSVR